MFIFLSPHFDDGIGSAGATIKRLIDSGEKCCLMTIMAAIPWHRPHKVIYVSRRRLENSNAARALRCRVKNAPFHDAIHRKWIRNRIQTKKQLFTDEITEPDLIKKISAYILKNTKPNDILIAPAGLGNHLDHRIVNAAVQGLKRKVYFYEEFFYDMDDKNDGSITSDYQYVFLNQTEIIIKYNAMLKYKKTLRQPFGGKMWKKGVKEYFMEKRIHNGNPYERFNDSSFLGVE